MSPNGTVNNMSFISLLAGCNVWASWLESLSLWNRPNKGRVCGTIYEPVLITASMILDERLSFTAIAVIQKGKGSRILLGALLFCICIIEPRRPTFLATCDSITIDCHGSFGVYPIFDVFDKSIKVFWLEVVNDGFIWPDWLQREPAVVERDNKCSPPTTHTHPHPTKPAQLHHQHWLRQFIFNKHNYHDRSTYPNSFQRFLRNRHEQLTYVAYLYHPSDTISQITTARP